MKTLDHSTLHTGPTGYAIGCNHCRFSVVIRKGEVNSYWEARGRLIREMRDHIQVLHSDVAD